MLGDPINFSDSTGHEAKLALLDATGRIVEIEIPIKYIGPGATVDRIERTNAAIEDTWTGTVGAFEVLTRVIEGGWTDNVVYLSTEQGRSRGKADRWFVFYEQSSEDRYNDMAAHEAGHMMGLPDYYHELAGELWPIDGWQGNIMATTGGDVWPSNIVTIINNHEDLGWLTRLISE